MSIKRRRRVGAEIVQGGVHFCVWAPAHQQVTLVVGRRDLAMERDAEGYFSAFLSGAGAGTLYQFRPGSDEGAFPDPASRFQPDGPHGPSMVIDPSTFRWKNEGPGVERKGTVLYEMHIGTFTREGTWRAAITHFPRLAKLGVTCIEMMPVHEFPGTFGWGYDGVGIWAPTHLYGEPDDLRAFVDAAHATGLAVILDVVYNHLGPDGCFLTKFTPHYFTERYVNDWGEAVNFDGPDSSGVREFFIENAAYWIDEFHFDGLRLDATQSIHDSGDPHVMTEICAAARHSARGRDLLIVGENERQDVVLLDQYGLDMLWNDDWHHSTHVAATGKSEAYYTDYAGSPQEFISMAKFGFLYQGQYYRWQKGRRGTPSLDIPPERLITYLENHDQVANSARGERLDRLTSPGQLRALTTLLLLLPQTPMLFQGQEFGSSAPFLYFADHKPDLARDVAAGRHKFLAQFPSMDSDESRALLAPPHDRATFERCKLDHDEAHRNVEAVALHRDLLQLRRSDAVFAAQRNDILHGAVLGDETFVLRWINAGEDRVIIVNLGRQLRLNPAPEPLLAPPRDRKWSVLFSTESPAYGGSGTAPAEVEGENWIIPSHAAIVFTASHDE